MNPADREAMFAISPDGLLCQSREHSQWQGGRGNVGLVKGKHYFETLMTDEGLCRIGWSTLAATLNLGTDNQGYGFGGTGKKSFARAFDSYGETYGLNDVGPHLTAHPAVCRPCRRRVASANPSPSLGMWLRLNAGAGVLSGPRRLHYSL